MLFRIDTNIAFQNVGILFVHVRTVLLNLSTERRTCLKLISMIQDAGSTLMKSNVLEPKSAGEFQMQLNPQN